MCQYFAAKAVTSYFSVYASLYFGEQIHVSNNVDMYTYEWAILLTSTLYPLLRKLSWLPNLTLSNCQVLVSPFNTTKYNTQFSEYIIFFIVAYPFLYVAGSMGNLYISRSYVARPTLQTVAPSSQHSSMSFSQCLFGLPWLICLVFDVFSCPK